MLQREILVSKCATVNAIDTSSIALKSNEKWLSILHWNAFRCPYIHEIATLNHKIFDDSMEIGSFEAQWNTIFAIFARTKLPEIFTCHWHHIGEQLQNHSSNFL